MKNFMFKHALTVFAVGAFIFSSSLSASAQQPAPPQPAQNPIDEITVNPNDVNSIDSIIAALYDVISGDAGKQRDWNRFRTLFYKDARLIPSGKNAKTGITGANSITPEDYIKRADPGFMKDGFFEIEVARKTETFGNIAHVFTTYQAKRKMTDEKPFLRGINSIQLLNDGKRWWVLNVFWQAETPETPLPKKYLKGKN